MTDKEFIKLQKKIQETTDSLNLMQILYESQTGRRFVSGQPITARPEKEKI